MQYLDRYQVSVPHPGAGCGAVPVERWTIPPGDGGIYETVAVMLDLIKQSQGHPIVRRHAERAVTGIDPTDEAEEVRAVWRYLVERVSYRRDPFVTEYLQAPWWVLSCGVERGHVSQLDCDDLTMLSLAMLGALGIETAIRVVSTQPNQEFNHVYGLVKIGGQWLPFDLTRAWQPPETLSAPETRSFEVEVAA